MYQALPPLIVGVKGHAYNFERERESLGPRLATIHHSTKFNSLPIFMIMHSCMCSCYIPVLSLILKKNQTTNLCIIDEKSKYMCIYIQHNSVHGHVNTQQ